MTQEAIEGLPPLSEEEEKAHRQQSDEADDRKIHVSRVPAKFDEGIVKRIFESNFGKDSVEEVVLIYPSANEAGKGDPSLESSKEEEHQEADASPEHRGFGFVTLTNVDYKNKAVQAKYIKGGRKETSTRKHTMYIREYQVVDKNKSAQENGVDVCYLWAEHRCPYGDDCKFQHIGPGAAMSRESTKKKQKCFAFKKTGTCKRGDACPFLHVFAGDKPEEKATTPRAKQPSEKDCISWKTKGKCSKKDTTCPYRHDPGVHEKALQKKRAKRTLGESDDMSSSIKKKKQKQPLSVRVFGLNYETLESSVRDFFEGCGPIVEITFPRFEDSGRSKGYCGVLFQSPKAVEKALKLDGSELDGRWLRIQSGKMLLDQWDRYHDKSKGGGELAEDIGKLESIQQ